MTSSVTLFDDPEAHSATLQNTCSDIRPDRAGPYTARLTQLRLAGIHMAMSEESLPRQHVCVTAADRVFFCLKRRDDPPSIRNGTPVVAGTVSVNRGGSTVDERTPGPAEWRCMSLALTDLAARCEVLLRRPMPALFGGAERVHPPPVAFARLDGLQRDVMRLAAKAPATLAHPAAIQALDERLGGALLALLDASAPRRDSAAGRHAHAILRRVAEFVEANEVRPISLSELCAVGDCSAKTLETVFLRSLGQTPIRYLRQRRLWLARRALLAASAGEATVSRIAQECGFWELGRFAVAYRQLFGETPSATLRRPAQAMSAQEFAKAGDASQLTKSA